MSVLVKGMKMPENCIKCPFAENVPPGRTRCLIMWRWLAEGYNAPSPERNEHCPLAALPDKHGDLIDRDSLLRDIEHYHLSDGKFQHWVEVQNTIVEAEGENEVHN